MALLKSKLEKRQAEATKLGLTFEKDATVVELEELIEDFKKAPATEDAPATEETNSRKTVKEEPKVVKSQDELVAEAKKGSFLVFDLNGNLAQVFKSEEDAQAHAEAIDGRYEEKE